jgi:hypothetical protein
MTQWPVFYSAEEYEASIQSVCSLLQSISSVKSIYQVGGISDYGISDIDMLVIFENSVTYRHNPLPSDGKSAGSYLFTHRLFGTTENRLEELENFTRFGKYKLLHGKPQTFALTLPEPKLNLIEKQIALEYLLKAFISLHIAITFGLVKIRNLLLHVKALKLDLELLGINHGSFYELVLEFIAMRKTWFVKTPGAELLEKKILELYQSYQTMLEKLFQQYPFYLPGISKVNLSRNIELKSNPVFEPAGTGIPLILKKVIPESKRERILNRLFRFCFRIPVINRPVPEVIQQRYDYINTGVDFNKKHLPFFLCTAYGLDIFSRKS